MRMPQPPTLVLAATLVLAVCAPGRAAPDLTPPWPSVQRLADIAGTRVTFPSSSPFVLSDRRASCEAPTAALATLFLPPGASAQSPAPAAIILHGAAGVMWARELTYARQLASMGVAALVIDAFAARRERASRFIDRLIEITEAMVLADAFAGLRYLAGRADVDAGRVALIGFSYGGMAATYAAYDQVARRFAPGGERFAGHVAFYAPCIVTFRDNRATGAPVLMLFGGRDAIVDRGRCEGTAGALRSGGAPVEVVVYEDAYHQWDGRFARPREIGRNLAGCRLVVERDGGVHHGRWLLPMLNPWTRKLILALCADQAGYLIGRDDDVRARSNADLARFLDKVFRTGSD